LQDIISLLGIEELSARDRLIVTRARRLQRFLTQPFAVTEAFTGKLLQMENHTNLMLKKRI